MTDRQHRARDTARYACPSRRGKANGTEISVFVPPCLTKPWVFTMLVPRNPQLCF